MVWHNDTTTHKQPTKHQHQENVCIYMYVIEQSEQAWKILAISHLKPAIYFNILFGTSDILSV